jgi:lipopolysaccharide/colanic/teichoic acid biosynthesis glycosyltransferase
MTLAFSPPTAARACAMRVERCAGQTLLVAEPLVGCRLRWRAVKRATDIVLALVALVAFSPVMALAALATYLDSGRPIFFRQTRVGRGGENFEIFKFRTMPLNVESVSGPMWSPGGDSRPTRVGRFLRRTSFDELPQLFNVLRGEMSLVGPRPERPCFVEQFAHQYRRYDDRHLMKPGITGWAHVQMRRNPDRSELGARLDYDLFYIENWSPFLDALVLVKTAAEFLFQRAS